MMKEEGKCIVSEMNSHTTHPSPRSELRRQATARAVGNDLRRAAGSRMKPGGTRYSEVAAAEKLQAFQMSSPAYSFHRTVPRAAAVVLECELDGDRATNSPGRCRNRRKSESIGS